MKRCQIFGKTLYYEGDISYFEAINKETLGNALLRLRQMGMLDILHSKPTTGTCTGSGNVWIALSPQWTPTDQLPQKVAEAGDFKSTQSSEKQWASFASGELTQANEASGVLYDSDLGMQQWNRLRPAGKLWDFCEHIGRFRREGKNRRDTSTVAARGNVFLIFSA